MAVDYGYDVGCLDDFTEECRPVTGRRLLAEALVRRLTTPRGMVIDDPDYGTDVREYLKDGLTPRELARMRAEILAELRKDERVVVTIASLDFVSSTGSLTIGLVVEATEEALRLVLSVSSVTVALLSVEGA
jgi:phage baseplate assembly protein W